MMLTMASNLAATALGGLLAGLSFDGALVKLPARYRIGLDTCSLPARLTHEFRAETLLSTTTESISV
jgi:hypothetical protein